MPSLGTHEADASSTNSLITCIAISFEDLNVDGREDLETIAGIVIVMTWWRYEENALIFLEQNSRRCVI